MRILRRIKETYADGPGIRYSIYVSGCTHRCKGCHNPESWNFKKGVELTEELISEIKQDIKENPLLDGITISGGDPLHPDNAEGLLYLLQELSDLDMNVWVYTGYTIEELLSPPIDYNQLYCLSYIDILVDGPYKEELKDLSGFCGSTNQRFIKAKKVYENGKFDPSVHRTSAGSPRL